MGGKKKGKKGKKKGAKKGGIADDATADEKCWILQAEKEALEQKLIVVLQEANASKRQMQEKRQREIQLKDAFDAQKQRSMDIVSDMTRQYKSTQDELTTLQSKLDL